LRQGCRSYAIHLRKVRIGSCRLARSGVRRIITTEKIVDVSQHGLERVVVSTIRVQRITLEEVLGRFFMLAKGLHRIRHYGLFASTMKAENLARMRELLGVATPEPDEVAAD
jgi:hypothetical protein